MAKRVSKQVRKKRTIRVILITVIVLSILVAVIGILRRQVTRQFNQGSAEEVLSASVSRGSISTTVSGSGNLTDEDVEAIKLHKDVEIDELFVEDGDTVEAGDLVATVNMSSVLSAMADIQTQLNKLDNEIGKASGDELDNEISATISGRVMKIYAQTGDDVSTVMYEEEALALLSLDGYMAVNIISEELEIGDNVTVSASDGTDFEGVVDAVEKSSVVILISDENAVYGDKVMVYDSEGNSIGSGKLYIHQMMKITGIAGTIENINISENQKINANDSLFTLTDISFSANYNSLLEERSELEEQLINLITIYQDGAIMAPISGTISDTGTEDSSSSSANMYGSMQTTQSTTTNVEEQTVLSICPGTKMTVSISVDETDILSLEVGQSATISVDALADETVEGTVTEIDTTATSSGGVTVYTVTVAFDKTEDMLSGMSASVAIVIEGVENALLIPSDALTQTSAKSYVYTSYDEETGELGGLVEVTAGMNNGEYAEITDGLNEGDTVYYFESVDTGFSFGNGGMPGGFGSGSMPSGFGGGGMPEGFGGMPSGFGN